MNRQRRRQIPQGGTYSIGLLLGTLATCFVPTSASAQDLSSGFETPNRIEEPLADIAAPQPEGSLAEGTLAETVVDQQENSLEGVPISYFFSLNALDDLIHRYLRPISTSGLFDD